MLQVDPFLIKSRGEFIIFGLVMRERIRSLSQRADKPSVDGESDSRPATIPDRRSVIDGYRPRNDTRTRQGVFARSRRKSVV